MGDRPARDDTVKPRGEKWVVLSESGKELGEYDTKGEAEKRLTQIEMFKHRRDG